MWSWLWRLRDRRRVGSKLGRFTNIRSSRDRRRNRSLPGRLAFVLSISILLVLSTDQIGDGALGNLLVWPSLLDCLSNLCDLDICSALLHDKSNLFRRPMDFLGRHI